MKIIIINLAVGILMSLIVTTLCAISGFPVLSFIHHITLFIGGGVTGILSCIIYLLGEDA